MPVDAAVARLQRMSVPVFAEAYEGLGDIQGVLSYDGQCLRLSFHTADALFGLLKSKAQDLELALDSVEDIEFGLGWFWLMPFLQLRLNDFALLSKVPAAKHGRLRLRVRFADRHLARRFGEQLRFARAEHLHRAIDGSLPMETEQASPPPPQVLPVQAPPASPVQAESAADPASERQRRVVED